MSIPTKIRTQPRYNQETHTCKQCNKCGGTGFYCMGVMDGRPYSYTGFACNKCGGKGWQIRTKKVVQTGPKKVNLVGSRATIDAAIESGKYNGCEITVQYID